ncbi:MAG: ribosome hibernation-promoting factor, HPF/YfiA family [Acutalibacteraceae bacterium]
MKITMTGRKVTLRPTFVERTETKLSKLDKFFDTDAAADVTVTAERDLHRVEVTIRCSGMVFRAEEAAEDMNEAVDRLVDILLRQIRKNKTRLEKRLRSGAFVDSIEPEAEESETYRIVRSKSFPVKPLDVEEAILQMNLTGHQFYMFRNMDSGEINVVYRRKNGDYGLLEPNPEE